MDVVIAGGHGKVARLLTRRLTGRGDRVRGIIRAPEQADDLRDDGAEPVVLDLERASAHEVATAVAGSDALVFAAGAGPGSGAVRKATVDYGAAATTIGAAGDAGVARYIMVSSMGADDPPAGDEVFSVYLRAKARADRLLAASGLDWTIVRPGRLTDEPGTGRVAAGEHVGRGAIPREDVAAVLAAVLDDPRTAELAFEVVSGDIPVGQAVSNLGGNGQRSG